MPGKHYQIKIRKREKPESGKPEFVASPGKQHVKKSDTVMFMAQGTNSVIFIPNANQLFDISSNSLTIELKSGNQTQSYTISENVTIGDDFPYAVYCDEDNDFAEGGSSPRIIID